MVMMVKLRSRKQSWTKKDVIRVKAKKYEKSISETKTFSVDPELTNFSTLRELLIKAFNIKDDFVISYLVSGGHVNDDRYLPMLSEWDLNTAIYAASDPYLILKVDLKSLQRMNGLEEWDIIDDDDLTRLSKPASITCVPVVREVSLDQSLDIPPRKRRSWFFDRPDSTVDSNARNRKSTPMTETEFRTYLDAEGRLLHSESFRETVYRFGLDPKARPTVWPHLLNIYPDGSTADERSAYVQRLCQKYECLKESWQRRLKRGYIDEELRLVANSVRKDVIRTDRSHPFFAGDEDRNTNLMALFNLLTTYALAHPEVSYCQGMSDLASPLLMILKDESMTYLCFCSLMRRTRDNFSCDGWTMTRKFHHLSELVQYYDPIFFEYLREMHSEDLLFSYRWLLLELKREFNFDDVMILMEVTWASLPARSTTDRDSGCESDLYDVDLTAYGGDDETPTTNRWQSFDEREDEEKDDDGGTMAPGDTVSTHETRFAPYTNSSTTHSCPGIFACANGVCPALVVRSLMLNHKENRRLHAIRHASYPPKFTYDDGFLERSSKNRRDRFTIGCLTDDMKTDIDIAPGTILEPIFDDGASSTSSSPSDDQISKNPNQEKNQPNQSTRIYALRPSPELKVSDSNSSDLDFNRQPVPMAEEAYSDFQCQNSDQGHSELTLTRIHEICLANIPMDESAAISSKASSACISRRSREPSGAGSGPGLPSNSGSSAFTTTDISHFSATRASSVNTADSGIYDSALNRIESIRDDLINASDFVNIDRDPSVFLPPPNELGDGNPFMLFVCLTIILQNRDQIMKSKLDFNEIAVYFDKLMRKHDVRKVLKRARILYADYLRTNGKPERDSDLGISKAVAVSGTKFLER